MKWRIINQIQFKETLEKPLMLCLSHFLGEGTNQNVETCGPSPWPTLTNGMSYSCVQSISVRETA